MDFTSIYLSYKKPDNFFVENYTSFDFLLENWSDSFSKLLLFKNKQIDYISDYPIKQNFSREWF